SRSARGLSHLTLALGDRASAAGSALGFILGLALLARQQLLADAGFDVAGDLRVLRQEVASIFLALTDALTVVAVPGAGFFHHALGHADIDDLAHARDAGAVHDLELGLAERRGDLVLHHLHPGLVADHFIGALDGADAADVQTHRG